MRDKIFFRECREILAPLPDVLISYRIYFWLTPLSIISGALITPREFHASGELPIWLFIAALGHLSMLPFVIYGQSRKGFSEQIALVLFMGFTRGAVIALLAQLYQLEDSTPYYFRVLNSTVSAFYAFQICAILIHFMSGFRKEVKQLIEESILQEEPMNLPSHSVTSNILLARISELQKSVMKTLDGAPTKEALEKRARDIDKLVREHIRPLSHSEWREGQLMWLKTGFLKVISTTLSRNPLPLWGVIILTLPFSLAGQLARYGILETLVLQAMSVLLMLFARKIATDIARAADGDYLHQNLLFFALNAACVGPICVVVQANWPGNSFSLGSILLTQNLRFFIFTLFCIATALVLALDEDQRIVFRTISQNFKSKDLKSFLELGVKAKAESEYAQYLHAEVQSQLLACKLLLLKAAESDFTLFPPEVTKQILARLEQINQPYERMPTKMPSKRVEELAQSWRGLAQIQYSLTPGIDGEDAPREVIAQLIEESVVNAIRHGKAKNIRIKAFEHNEDFSIEIFDDGTLGESTGGKGLGSILFDTFASSWSLTREGNETLSAFDVAKKGALR